MDKRSRCSSDLNIARGTYINEIDWNQWACTCDCAISIILGNSTWLATSLHKMSYPIQELCKYSTKSDLLSECECKFLLHSGLHYQTTLCNIWRHSMKDLYVRIPVSGEQQDREIQMMIRHFYQNRQCPFITAKSRMLHSNRNRHLETNYEIRACFSLDRLDTHGKIDLE